MPMMSPDITVVIPTYNRKEYLQQAIASCFAGNEAIDVEVVVVDDGSTDGTRAYLEQLDDARVRPILQEHQGGQAARNRGLAEAQGQYIKFLDDDDWLAEGALVTEVNMLNQSGADVSFAGYAFVEADGTPLHQVDTPEVDDFVAGLLDGRILTHPLRLTYASQLAEQLHWNEQLPCRQDVDFVFQAALQDPEFARIPESIAFFRQHEGPRVSSGAAMHTEPARIHAQLLIQMTEAINERDLWTPARRSSAAHGLWTWAHLMAGVEWAMFEKMYRLIQQIQADFQPERQHGVLKLLDNFGNPAMTERLMYPLRKVKQQLNGQ